MAISDYKAPRTEVIEVNVQSVLCQSTGNTENFILGSNSYGEDDWN